MTGHEQGMIIQVSRYLGYGAILPDSDTSTLIQSCLAENDHLEQTRSTYRFFPIVRSDDKLGLEGTNLFLSGADIDRHLSRASACLLMAVTLGHEVDRKIRFYQKSNFSRAVILDACATAVLEQACNDLIKHLSDDLLQVNQKLSPRYSPGYGDFPLEIQKSLVETLGAHRSIGLTVTSTSILIPRKSITAIAGVIDMEQEVATYTCVDCDQPQTCQFSKV